MNKIDTGDLRDQLIDALRLEKLVGTVETGFNQEMQYVWARWSTSTDGHVLARGQLKDFAQGFAPMVKGFVHLCLLGTLPRGLNGLLVPVKWEVYQR